VSVNTYVNRVREEADRRSVETVSVEGVRLKVDKEEVVERIVRYLVSGKTLLLSNEDVWRIARNMAEEIVEEERKRLGAVIEKHGREWVVDKVSEELRDILDKALTEDMNTLTTVDRDKFTHYLVLPEDIELSGDEGEVFHSLLELAVDPIYAAQISGKVDIDVDYAVAYYLFRTVGQSEHGGLLFGDPLAWLLRRLAKSYGVEPDEEITEWENKEYGTWSRLYRYGDTVIRVKRDYTNRNCIGVDIGVDVGVFYSFADKELHGEAV